MNQSTAANGAMTPNIESILYHNNDDIHGVINNSNGCFISQILTPDQFEIVSISSILADIQHQKHKSLVDKLPDSVAEEEAYKAAKKRLPAWAFNGTFSGSVINDNFKESSGFFHFDIDKLDDVNATKKNLINSIPEIYALWLSPSGRGLKGLLRIPDDFIHNDAEFKIAYFAVESYFAQFGVTLDKSGKDVRRLCFVCRDPDIYINPSAPPFICSIQPLPEQTQYQSTPHNPNFSENEYIKRACKILHDAKTGEYHNARLRAGKLAGGFVAAGCVEESAIKAELNRVSDEISASHNDNNAIIKNAHRAIDDGFNEGLLAPVDVPETDFSVLPFPTYAQTILYGLAGEVARLACENSEADPMAVYATFLVEAAALIGRRAYINVGDTRHCPRIFAVIVGKSSRSRKGTSEKPATKVILKAEELYSQKSGRYASLNKQSGLSSGEGLIYAVRDASDDDEIDEGVKDKRLLIIEEEFSSVLKVAQRDGNTLSQIIRCSWDYNSVLSPMTKHNRIVSTDPHINILGHITHDELNLMLSKADKYNGFANRFLWCCVQRPKKLAFPTPMDEDKVLELAKRLADCIARDESEQLYTMSAEAKGFWNIQYHIVSEDKRGVVASVTSRAETHILRLALLFCLLDNLDMIEICHIQAAIDFVGFCNLSAEYIFATAGDAEVEKDSQKLLQALGAKKAMTQTEISKVFNNHKKRDELRAMLSELEAAGKIRQSSQQGSKLRH